MPGSSGLQETLGYSYSDIFTARCHWFMSKHQRSENDKICLTTVVKQYTTSDDINDNDIKKKCHCNPLTLLGDSSCSKFCWVKALLSDWATVFGLPSDEPGTLGDTTLWLLCTAPATKLLWRLALANASCDSNVGTSVPMAATAICPLGSNIVTFPSSNIPAGMATSYMFPGLNKRANGLTEVACCAARAEYWVGKAAAKLRCCPTTGATTRGVGWLGMASAVIACKQSNWYQ